MKKYLIISILCLISEQFYGQVFRQTLYCNASGDSIFKIAEIKERDLFYRLFPLDSLKSEYSFRSWAGNSCVEIVQQNGKLSGFIHFATQKYTKTKSRQKKTFTVTYVLDRQIVDKLYSKIKSYSFVRRAHESGDYPVAHTFLLKENSKVEIYTTDVPILRTEIFNIIPMNYYLDKFEKEIPFRKFIDWDFLKDDSKFYQTKGNG